ncbi:MAG: transporter [Bradyrhizobiaceae bacterium]|nr:transporter [Bradyrhizobiaceae bacterium]
MSTLTKLVGAGALALATTSAFAGSVPQPGSSIGIATGTPLAPGWYFIDTLDWGVRDTAAGKIATGVNIPVLAWSTPWTFWGARVQFLAAVPQVETGVLTTGPYLFGFYNPLLAGQLAWDLGRTGWGFSYQLGAFFGVNTPVAFNSSSLNQAFALSYTGNGWDLTGNVIWGTQINTDVNPDFLNLDLTATKKFGNWELGLVGFGSTDLNRPAFDFVGRQSQFALGGLVGYNFGPVILQAYLTRDVTETNYGGFDTRFWGRIIIPMLDPVPVRPAPIRR